MIALLLVALSLGLSNFAAAISVSVTSVDARTRLRVGLTFGIFEAGMPAGCGSCTPAHLSPGSSLPGSDGCMPTSCEANSAKASRREGHSASPPGS
jgi:hypothetical protein